MSWSWVTEICGLDFDFELESDEVEEDLRVAI